MRISNKNIKLQTNYLEVDQSDEALFNRFLKYVLITDGCWYWKGGQSLSNKKYQRYYGTFTISTGKQHYAHRVSYALHKGAIPHGMVVMHTCDNPLCVNPHHLVLGTPLDNMLDAKAKGRLKNCETHGRAKLTNQQVREIFKLDGHMKRCEIAKMFKMAPTTISAILNGRIWKDLPDAD